MKWRWALIGAVGLALLGALVLLPAGSEAPPSEPATAPATQLRVVAPRTPISVPATAGHLVEPAAAAPTPPDAAWPLFDAGLPPSPDAAVPAAPLPLPDGGGGFDATAARDEKSDRDERDRRFRVRWGQQGLCGDRSLAKLHEAREQLLTTFQLRTFGELTVLADPMVDVRRISLVAESTTAARALVGEWIDWPPNSPPPVVVVYRDSSSMRAVACTSDQTVGYFDGRLHVSAAPELNDAMVGQTVVHEYVHYALNAQGIRRPMWLHEGLAMHVANETWVSDTRLDLAGWLAKGHLPFDSMVFAFPHTADEKFAVAAYFQSFRMVDFLEAQRGPGATRGLVRALAAGSLSPEDAFAAGTGLSPGDVEAHWQLFIQ